MKSVEIDRSKRLSRPAEDRPQPLASRRPADPRGGRGRGGRARDPRRRATASSGPRSPPRAWPRWTRARSIRSPGRCWSRAPGRATCSRSSSSTSCRSPTRFTGIMPGLGFLRDLYTAPYLVHWQIARRLGDLAAAPRGAHPGRAVHGRDRRGALARAGGRVGQARAGAAEPRGPGDDARSRGRGARQGRGRHRGPAHDPAARERRQHGRQADHQGRDAPAAGRGGGRAVLGGRRALRPGRRRGVRDRGRDGGHRGGEVQGDQGRGQDARIAARASATATTSPRRSGPRRSASSPPPACRSATTG